MIRPSTYDVADMFLLESASAAVRSAAFNVANTISASAHGASDDAAEFAARATSSSLEAVMWQHAYLKRQIERC